MYVDRGQGLELFKWVLLKLLIFVDVIIQLVILLIDDEIILEYGFRCDWILFYNIGMFLEFFLRNIFSKLLENEEVMKGFFEEYDIICFLFYKVINEK